METEGKKLSLIKHQITNLEHERKYHDYRVQAYKYLYSTNLYIYIYIYIYIERERETLNNHIVSYSVYILGIPSVRNISVVA